MKRILNFTEYILENFGYQYLTEALSNRSKRIFRNFFSSVIGDSNPLTDSQIEELYTKYSRGILLFQNWVLDKHKGKYLTQYGADGKWGTETKKAWDDLSASYLSEKNPDKLPLKDFLCPDEKSFGDQKLKFTDWNEPKKRSDGTSQNTTPTPSSGSSSGFSTQNIIIGDSQSPYVDWGSQKFNLISDKGSESALWTGGKNLQWLNTAVSNHSGSTEVKNIAICIGTNGGFNPKDNISGLVTNIKNKFPNAKLFAIQGSWGWGYIKDIKEEKVKNYYSIFSTNGVEVIEPAIGPIEPHGRKPIYKTIGKNLDDKLQ